MSKNKEKQIYFGSKDELEEYSMLGKISEIGSSKRIHQRDWKEKGIPFYRARDIVSLSQGKIIKDRLFIDNLLYEKNIQICGELKKNDILITGVGTIGIPYIVPNDEPLYYKDGNIIALKNNQINAHYLYYFFTSSKFVNDIKSRTGIGTVATFTIEMAKETKIKLSAYEKDIATILSQIDNLINNKYSIVKNYKSTREALIKEFFELKKEYNKVQFKDFLCVSENNVEKNVDKRKILRLGLHLKGLTTVSQETILDTKATKYYIRNEGELIYGKQNIFNGSIAIVPSKFDKYLSSSDVPTLQIDNKIIKSKFLLYYLSQKRVYSKLEIYTTGTGSKRLHPSELLNQTMYLPSLDRQEYIVKFLSQMDKLIEIEEKKLELLEKMKKYHLQQFFD